MKRNAKTNVITAMLLFGSIGLFIRGIELPSSVIALIRGIVGCLFLLAAALVTGQKISLKALKKNGIPLLLSGAAIGFNWIFLFEAYRYTTVACATLSYYFAPVFVILASPLILGERLSLKKGACVLGAVAGMVLVSNVLFLEGGFHDLIGVFFGLAAAALYACVVLFNKFIRDLSGIETTTAQLGVAALVLLPYTVVTALVPMAQTGVTIPGVSIALLAVVGILHTGIGYLLYFSGLQGLPAQTAAVLSYIDPVTAVLLSTVILHETMTPQQAVGAVLILGMTWLGERQS